MAVELVPSTKTRRHAVETAAGVIAGTIVTVVDSHRHVMPTGVAAGPIAGSDTVAVDLVVMDTGETGAAIIAAVAHVAHASDGAGAGAGAVVEAGVRVVVGVGARTVVEVGAAAAAAAVA
jgi:hypothetical protein